MPLAASSGTAQGLWAGVTSTGGPIYAMVFADGSSYILYPRRSNAGLDDMTHAQIASDVGSIRSTGATDVFFWPYVVSPAQITGAYNPRQSIAGTIATAIGTSTFSASYRSEYEIPANPADVAGTYVGTVSTSVGGQDVTATIGVDGSIAGGASGCTYVGHGAPHGTTNLFDFSLTFQGGNCLFGTATLTGAAFYDAASRVLYAALFTSDNADRLLFQAQKR